MGTELLIVSVDAPSTRLDRLTAAEREVLVLLLRHGTAARVARARRRSVRTVRHQIEAIYAKLDVTTRGELALLCGAA
jgi:DNA-binding CsgD family transcriptional regulator